MDGDRGRTCETRVLRFPCDGTSLEASLHLPSPRNGRVPVVVLADGFGTVRGFGGTGAVEAIVSRGIAVLTFDYRTFGGSEGEPRQLVDVTAQLDDLRAALRFVRTLPEVDTTRVGLSGTSYGGGHAITIAAEDPDVVALSVKVPHCDTRAAFAQAKLGEVVRNLCLAAADALGARLGRPPIELAIVGEPGERAVMAHPGWRARYLGLVPEGARWHNGLPARSLLAVGEYRPVTSAPRVLCPSLVIYSANDRGIPAASVQATIAALRDVSVETFEGDHFDVYDGPDAARLRAREAEFFANAFGLAHASAHTH